VERNPGPPTDYTRQQGVMEYTMDDLDSIYQWQQEKVQEPLEDANRYQSYGHYPLVLHRGDHDKDEFQDTYQHEQPVYLREPMTSLAIPHEVAEPSFLLMINRLEVSFEKKKDSIKLQEYGSVAMHLVNCLMHVMDVDQEESLSLMMMSCIQRRMELLHEETTRTTAALIVEQKTTASAFLANVVRLGLIRGSQQVDPEELRTALNAVGRTTRLQVQWHQWTPDSIRDTLTGDDTLGLGGNLFGQDFMAQLFPPPSVPPHEDPIPPVTHLWQLLLHHPR
jgi:hypothetical protein